MLKIPKERMEEISNNLAGLKIVLPEEKFYRYYKRMVDQWAEVPEWITIHNIYKEMRCRIDSAYYKNYDDIAANELAWQVFFNKYAINVES